MPTPAKLRSDVAAAITSADINLKAAKGIVELVPAAAQVDTAARMRQLMHGDYRAAAAHAICSNRRAMETLLKAAGSSATPSESRVHLLLCFAVLNESLSRLDEADEKAALEQCLNTLAEPKCPVELQAAARKLLMTARAESRKEA